MPPPVSACAIRVGRGRSLRRASAGARAQPASSHHSSTSAPGVQPIERLRDDRQRVGGGEGREDVAPLPAWPPASRTRTRPASSRAGEPSASRSAITRTKPRRPGLFDTASSRTARSTGRSSRSAAAGRGAGSPAARTARTSRSSTPGCPAARTAAPGRRRAARPSPNANGLPGWTATRHRSIVPDLLEREPDDVVRPDRHAARRRRSRRRSPASAAQSRASTSSSRSLAIPRSAARRRRPRRARAGPGRSRPGCPAGPSAWPAGTHLVAGREHARRAAAGGPELRRRRRPRPGRSPPA